MKRTLLSLAILFAGLSLFAEPIDLTKAEQTARQFLSKRGGISAASLKGVPAKRQLKNIASNDAPYYIFNIVIANELIIIFLYKYNDPMKVIIKSIVLINIDIPTLAISSFFWIIA